MTALSVRLLDKFMREMLLERFVAFYSDVYDGWTEEMLGFPPKEMRQWLTNQFEQNLGDWILLSAEEKGFETFLSFTPAPDGSCVYIHQLVGSGMDSFQLLANLYPQKAFYGVVRTFNEALLERFVKLGCKRLPEMLPAFSGYSPKYYTQIEMPVDAVRALIFSSASNQESSNNDRK